MNSPIEGVPYVGAGPLRFDMSPEEAAAALGKPQYVMSVQRRLQDRQSGAGRQRLLRRSVAEVQAVHNRQCGVIVDYDTELHLHNGVLRRACDIRGNEHVLDIGCGTGLTTREAARSAATGRVLGVDTSPAMLVRARELTEAEELYHVSFEQGDAQVHRLPPAYFDIAISRYGTMFFRDPVAAFRNIRGALVPGGRLVMMVWQDHAANEWSTSIQRCLAPDELEPIVSVEGLDPFSLSDPTKVERILTEAGFAETRFIDVCEPVYYGENVDVAIEWVRRFLFVRELLQRLDAASGERALERLRELLAAHGDGSGVWFDARAWIVTSRRQ